MLQASWQHEITVISLPNATVERSSETFVFKHPSLRQIAQEEAW
jgi:hypothetical protein